MQLGSTFLTGDLITNLLKIQYSVYNDIIANCIIRKSFYTVCQNKYDIRFTCNSPIQDLYDMYIYESKLLCLSLRETYECDICYKAILLVDSVKNSTGP